MGVSKNIENLVSAQNTYAGTVPYMSPEMKLTFTNKDITYSFNTDVWYI